MPRNFKLTIGVKIYGIIALCFVGLFVMVAFDIEQQSEALERQKQMELTHLGEMASGIVTEEYAAAQAKSISEDQAKKNAATRIGKLRFDNGNYFWINDMHPRVVMHPIKPEWAGKDVTDMKDGRGKPLYQPFVDIARKEGTGFARYDFPKPGVAEPQPKLSRIIGFAPWGWVIGTGVYIDDLKQQSWETARRALLLALVLVVVIGIVSTWVARRMSKAMRGMTGAMHELAAGRLDVVLPGLGRRDEIGEVASAVEAFKVKSTEKARAEAEAAQAVAMREADERRQASEREAQMNTATEAKAAAERRAAMHQLADQFEAAVGRIIDTVSSASNELETAAGSLMKTAEVTQERSASVTSASEEASANVQSVASATEEMTSSIHEISRQVQESSDIAEEAVRQAAKTDARISELSQAAGRIGDVVKLITAVAEQTNLLALNATIEAARAGEAGRGFAVVASEVKALAGQTAKATEEISSQIAGMQTATQDSVAAIKEIGGTIGRVSHISAAVAAAVEEQGAATREITSNVHQAARGTTEVAANITEVNRGAVETGTASSRVLTSARSLAGESSHLKNEVEKFLATVRAA